MLVRAGSKLKPGVKLVGGTHYISNLFFSRTVQITFQVRCTSCWKLQNIWHDFKSFVCYFLASPGMRTAPAPPPPTPRWRSTLGDPSPFLPCRLGPSRCLPSRIWDRSSVPCPTPPRGPTAPPARGWRESTSPSSSAPSAPCWGRCWPPWWRCTSSS